MQPTTNASIKEWISYYKFNDSRGIHLRLINKTQKEWLTYIRGKNIIHDTCQVDIFNNINTIQPSYCNKLDIKELNKYFDSMRYMCCFEENRMIIFSKGMYFYINSTNNDTIVLYSHCPSTLANRLDDDV